jgi:hypothetical protein
MNDDLCDVCMRSGVTVARTTADGRDVCTECDEDTQDYTVLLLNPDYANASGHDTYLAQVTALDVTEAKEMARVEAEDEIEVNDPDDFAVLAVFEGWQEDLHEE